MKTKYMMLISASVAALALASTGANAADFVRKVHKHVHTHVVPVVVPAPQEKFSWTGGYAGIEIGRTVLSMKSGKVKVGKFETNDDMAVMLGDKHPSGGSFGGFIGANYDFGSNLVAGLEADYDSLTVRESAPFVDNGTDELRVNYTGDLRLRLGYNAGNFLPYIAGGVSLAKMSHGIHEGSIDYDPPKASSKDKDDDNFLTGFKQHTAYGWNVGFGVDYAISKNMMLRADFRRRQISGTKFTYISDTQYHEFSSKAKFGFNDMHLGLGFKF